MNPSRIRKAINRSYHRRPWLYLLVLGVVSGLTACAVDRLWGEGAALNSFFFTTFAIPGLLGIWDRVNGEPDAGKKPDYPRDELV
jgi:hypothetical protein